MIIYAVNVKLYLNCCSTHNNSMVFTSIIVGWKVVHDLPKMC
ncbi:DEHA2G09284p [Debaryomyces hansenii CBS767]|uniref:DEHA2G09284p n=1 Tax=Debaryomyces hansenii (strain ATCC 36239 / CBS 767 / BCRC 21394 / JCM 1990 / NBRC 0083 / IGC 2968) TaxID=284592 RepID=Q6BIM0_DEBHA|nr:DEHA2G09284p [Debaryomyces hansenii CBS767]CAG90419.2 DEHA2G09284p [Debaryomyces hansenii CBS767]|eukprot:XP_461951.2 DEHA2G09284p [Debaryomyces hansenii CBS767]